MKIREFLSNEPVNTGRQKEIDLIKAFSIIMMIITHCIEELFDYGGHVLSQIIVDILNRTIGAAAFMICMGGRNRLLKKDGSQIISETGTQSPHCRPAAQHFQIWRAARFGVFGDGRLGRQETGVSGFFQRHYAVCGSDISPFGASDTSTP